MKVFMVMFRGEVSIGPKDAAVPCASEPHEGSNG
jgi:hypothetical protein